MTDSDVNVEFSIDETIYKRFYEKPILVTELTSYYMVVGGGGQAHIVRLCRSYENWDRILVGFTIHALDVCVIRELNYPLLISYRLVENINLSGNVVNSLTPIYPHNEYLQEFANIIAPSIFPTTNTYAQIEQRAKHRLNWETIKGNSVSMILMDNMLQEGDEIMVVINLLLLYGKLVKQ